MTSTIVVLVAAVAATSWLLTPATATLGRYAPSRVRPRRPGRASPRSIGTVALLAVAVWGMSPAGVRGWVVGAGVAMVAIAVRRLIANQRLRHQAARRGQQVVELCDACAAELHGGRTAAVALELACRDWPELGAVVTTSQLHGDVVAALRRAAELPGAEGLRAVAAACEVASGSGAALAGVIDRVAVALRHEAEAKAEVTASLGPPRATARMLMVLPLVGVALGTSMGARPVPFMLTTTLGLACLFGGVLLSLAGLFWVERLATAVER